jgi:hypothetical protein
VVEQQELFTPQHHLLLLVALVLVVMVNILGIARVLQEIPALQTPVVAGALMRLEGLTLAVVLVGLAL